MKTHFKDFFGKHFFQNFSGKISQRLLFIDALHSGLKVPNLQILTIISDLLLILSKENFSIQTICKSCKEIFL